MENKIDYEKFEDLMNKTKRKLKKYKENNLDIYELRELNLLYEDYNLIETLYKKGSGCISYYDYNKLEEINKLLKVYKKNHRERIEG